MLQICECMDSRLLITFFFGGPLANSDELSEQKSFFLYARYSSKFLSLINLAVLQKILLFFKKNLPLFIDTNCPID